MSTKYQAAIVGVLSLVSFLVAAFIAAQLDRRHVVRGHADSVEPTSEGHAEATPHLEDTADLVRAVVSTASSEHANPHDNGHDEEHGPLAEPIDEPVEEGVEPYRHAVSTTLASPVAQMGVEQLQSRLTGEERGPEAFALQSALIASNARLDPPDFAAMEVAFQAAYGMTTNAALRAATLALYAKVLVERGQAQKALEAITQARTGLGAEASPELGIIEGIALENAGESGKAVAAYEGALATISSTGVPSAKDINMFRQAALRLSRLYRAAGDTEKAERLPRELKVWTTE